MLSVLLLLFISAGAHNKCKRARRDCTDEPFCKVQLNMVKMQCDLDPLMSNKHVPPRECTSSCLEAVNNLRRAHASGRAYLEAATDIAADDAHTFFLGRSRVCDLPSKATTNCFSALQNVQAEKRGCGCDNIICQRLEREVQTCWSLITAEEPDTETPGAETWRQRDRNICTTMQCSRPLAIAHALCARNQTGHCALRSEMLALIIKIHRTECLTERVRNILSYTNKVPQNQTIQENGVCNDISTAFVPTDYMQREMGRFVEKNKVDNVIVNLLMITTGMFVHISFI